MQNKNIAMGNKNLISHARGFSLIEIMVANLLSTLLIMLLFFSYYQFDSLYQYQNSIREVLENARFAIYVLHQQLHMTGLRCLSQTNYVDIDQRIYGFNSNQVSTNFKNKLKPASDLILFKSCQMLNKKQQYISSLLFIAKSECQNKNHFPKYSLFIKRAETPAEELVSGIENWHVKYAIACKDSNNICAYQQAKYVNDWTKVVAVQINLLFSTDEKSTKKYKISKEWHTYISLPRKI